MKSANTLLPICLTLLLLQWQACSNGNSTQENTQATDSTNIQSNIPSDTTQAELVSGEENEGESDDEYHDYDYKGVYIGTNASLKLELNDHFYFYEGHQLKMKGEISFSGTEDHMNIALSPYGKNKEMIELNTHWGNMESGTYDMANYVVWGSDTLFRQMEEYH